MAEACGKPREELTGIFPGSWIDANFYIWIGHADDQRAWSQLADARRAARAVRPSADAANLVQAREEVLIAEGSDWFWWYGDDHSSAHDIEFDDLFRRHLRNVYKLLGKPVPDELFVSNISTGVVAAAAETSPSAFFTPTLDGEETSYFEWLGAGAIEIRDVSGAMHRTDGRSSLLACRVLRVRPRAVLRAAGRGPADGRSARRGPRDLADVPAAGGGPLRRQSDGRAS